MVKHIVMWKLVEEKDGLTTAQLATEMKKRLMALEGVITELKSIEVGINAIHPDKNSDVVLTTTFDSFEDLAAYAIHPKHLEVGAFIKDIVTQRACVDFEF